MAIRQYTLSDRERIETFYGTEEEEISGLMKHVRKFVKEAEGDNRFPYDVHVRFDFEGIAFAEVRYTI